VSARAADEGGVKPTKAQLAVLARMATGEELLHFPDFRLAAVGTERLNIQTFVSMVRRGLVTYECARWTEQGIPCGRRYQLTDTGRRVLAAGRRRRRDGGDGSGGQES
jgi:hypothetical protein